MSIKVGDTVPSVKVWAGFPAWGGQHVDTKAITAGKVIVMGLPGAFTPC